MHYLTISYEKRGHVAIVTLNRPDDSNAINLPMARELDSAVQDIADDEDVRVVVLTGAGQTFSTGSDLDLTSAAREDNSSKAIPNAIPEHRIASTVARLEYPVIAAINGNALGQGLELALACDIRLAADSARMALDQIRSGIIPWDGATQRLPRLIGRGSALSLILLGEPIDAQEALRIGLVHRLYPKDTLLAEAIALAEKIATYAPIALRYAKEAISKGMEMTLDQGLRMEQDLTVILQSTDDRAEGISSFLEKRAPGYKGR